MWELMDAYNKNKDQLSIEFYEESATILGLTVGIFMLLFIVNIVLYIWSIVALVKFGGILPTSSIVLAIAFLFLGFPIGSLLAIYVGKNSVLKTRSYY